MNIDFACNTISTDQLMICSFSLTKSELHVLKHFWKNSSSKTIKEISDELGLERSGVQKAVKSLVEKGLVERRQINNENGGFFFRYSLKDKEGLKTKVLGLLDIWTNNAKTAIKNI